MSWLPIDDSDKAFFGAPREQSNLASQIDCDRTHACTKCRHEAAEDADSGGEGDAFPQAGECEFERKTNSRNAASERRCAEAVEDEKCNCCSDQSRDRADQNAFDKQTCADCAAAKPDDPQGRDFGAPRRYGGKHRVERADDCSDRHQERQRPCQLLDEIRCARGLRGVVSGLRCDRELKARVALAERDERLEALGVFETDTNGLYRVGSIEQVLRGCQIRPDLDRSLRLLPPAYVVRGRGFTRSAEFSTVSQ